MTEIKGKSLKVINQIGASVIEMIALFPGVVAHQGMTLFSEDGFANCQKKMPDFGTVLRPQAQDAFFTHRAALDEFLDPRDDGKAPEHKKA